MTTTRCNVNQLSIFPQEIDSVDISIEVTPCEEQQQDLLITSINNILASLLFQL